MAQKRWIASSRVKATNVPAGDGSRWLSRPACLPQDGRNRLVAIIIYLKMVAMIV